MSKARFLTPAIVIALIVAWILLLSTVVTAQFRKHFYLASVEQSVGTTRFGVFDYNGRTMSSHSPGYEAEVSFHLRYPFDENGELLPLDQMSSNYKVLDTSDTAPLILFPVTLGIAGLSLICLLFINNKNNRVWRLSSALFAGVAAVLGWTAWAFAFRLAAIIESNLTRQMTVEDVRDPRPVVQRGNVIWPTFVGLLLLTFASILLVVKAIQQRRERSSPERAAQRHSTPSPLAEKGEPTDGSGGIDLQPEYEK